MDDRELDHNFKRILMGLDLLLELEGFKWDAEIGGYIEDGEDNRKSGIKRKED